jgi:hypothetical protein
MAASMAVNREAPNEVIAAIRRCSPYTPFVTLSLCRRAPGIPAKAHIDHRKIQNTRCRHFCVAHCARNSTKYNLLARHQRRRLRASLDGIRIAVRAWGAISKIQRVWVIRGRRL